MAKYPQQLDEYWEQFEAQIELTKPILRLMKTVWNRNNLNDEYFGTYFLSSANVR